MGEDLSHLLEEADITDNIHDVILQVNQKSLCQNEHVQYVTGLY